MSQGKTVVGIAGGSCSGKSTLAIALKDALDAELIQMDRYMLGAKGPQITLSTGDTHPHCNLPETTDNEAVVAAIHESNGPIVIVEGLMVLAIEPIRSLLDLRLFVELEPPARAIRRIVRNLAKTPDASPEWIGRYYLECAVPGHERHVEPSRVHADLIVRGDGATDRTVNLLKPLILSSAC